MKAPRILTVCETHAGGRHLATVTMQVPIEDLEALLGHCDLEVAMGAGLEQALATSKVARDRRDREAELVAAKQELERELERGALLASNAAAAAEPPIATPATSDHESGPDAPPTESAPEKPPAPTGETLLGLAVAKDPMH